MDVFGYICLAVGFVFAWIWIVSKFVIHSQKKHDNPSSTSADFNQKLAHENVEKNSNILFQFCESCIGEYEKELNENNVFAPSCKSDLLDSVSRRIAKDPHFDEKLTTAINFEKIAHSLLANCAFNLLASGKYHVYRGMLNPMNCSTSLMHIYNKCMDYAVATGEITPWQKEDQKNYLAECIAEVG